MTAGPIPCVKLSVKDQRSTAAIRGEINALKICRKPKCPAIRRAGVALGSGGDNST